MSVAVPSASSAERIAVVVVTYNRCALLLDCLAALCAQSRAPDHLLVVDNASTDGTEAAVAAAGFLARDDFEYLRLPDNRGGAGGFAAGLAHALAAGADRVWMMDDDALPAPDALERLLDAARGARDVYGSVAIAGERLAWAMQLVADGRRVLDPETLPAVAEVGFLPFLGILVPAALVADIGLPEAGYFLAADDLEFCLRARAAGACMWLVAASRIAHPPSVTYEFGVPGLRLHCLRLAPWKRYYDTRNRILLARRHFGPRLWTATLPSIALRLVATLVHEPGRVAQLRATLAGVLDGLSGREGRRHERWRLGA